MNTRIVITGIGLISAIGKGRRETLEYLLQEKTGVSSIRLLPTKQKELPVGEVPYSNEQLADLASWDINQPITRSALMGIIAAREALQQATLMQGHTKNMAFLNGTTVGGMDITETFYRDEKNKYSFLPFHETGACTTEIANALGGFKYQTTISTACSSALNAVIRGTELLQKGEYKQVLVGGTECLTRFHLNGFRSLMILDSQPCRPFSNDRNGLNLGEGAAYLVLETEQSALERGVEPLAYIAGYGNRSDAYHQTASSPDGEGAYLAMSDAVSMAKVSVSEVDYINAHGTATANNDQSEAMAIKRLFGENKPLVSSTKAFTGHTTSASGSIELAICVLCMQGGFVPANLNMNEQMPESDTLNIAKHTIKTKLRYVLCNAFAFGGNDSSVLLSSEPADLPLLKEIKRAKVVSDKMASDEADIKQYMSAMEARRLSKSMQQLYVVAMEAIKESGLKPTDIDAIICGTRFGCIDYSLQILDAILTSDESDLKPTLFMQSTHNTPASMLAIKTKNHAYNCTYSHCEKSFQDAKQDALDKIQTGMINNALVVGYDEQCEKWQDLMKNSGSEYQPQIRAIVIL
ncbi:MAG: beta-ketoacyl-[Paludibacteraceae bacterium]|nr:beta-ketoacyl-[acyl-carrier-protein] synthase family protein [Paludibacteraceae bacterium]